MTLHRIASGDTVIDDQGRPWLPESPFVVSVPVCNCAAVIGHWVDCPQHKVQVEAPKVVRRTYEMRQCTNHPKPTPHWRPDGETNATFVCAECGAEGKEK